MATTKPERMLNTNPNLMVAIISILATREQVTYLPIIAWLLGGTEEAPTPVTVLGAQGIGAVPLDGKVSLIYDQSMRKVLVDQEWVPLNQLRSVLDDAGYLDTTDEQQDEEPLPIDSTAEHDEVLVEEAD